MARDQSEYIDDYCRDNYGHTNWGYLDTYTKEELEKNEHDIEGNIVYFHEDSEEEWVINILTKNGHKIHGHLK